MPGVSDYPKRHGIVYGFGYGNPYFIGDVMRDLKLKSPHDFWLWVSYCTKKLEMGDPTVDFLVLLDILRSGIKKKPPNRIGEFRCDDEIQMKTYADLVSKLYDAELGHKGPIETEKLLSAARDYLACCDIGNDTLTVFASAKGEAAKKAVASGCRIRCEKRFGGTELVLAEPAHTSGRAGKENNMICVLRSTDGENLKKASLDLLRCDGVINSVLKASFIESTLIEALLSHSHGLEINVCGTEQMCYPLAEICTSLQGHWLIEILPSELYVLQMIGAEYRLSVSPIASVKKKKGIEFICPQGRYSIKPELLCEVLHDPAHEALAEAEADMLAPPIFECAEYVHGDDLSFFASDIIKTGCSYYDGSAALISAVSKAVALGFDLSRITLTNVITLNENHASGKLPPRLVSYSLGLYRAQMELCLSDAGSTVEYGDADNISVIAMTEGEGKSTDARCGNVYLASPAMSDEGFPDYGELRRLFKFVSGAVTTGKCKAVAIDAEGALAAVLKLCGGDASVNVDSVKLVPGSFLLLSEERIEGLEILGSFGGEAPSLV